MAWVCGIAGEGCRVQQAFFEKTSHWQALEHLSREETPFGILTAVPLMHDKALWINCLVRLQG
jgi:hypothetical protein